MHNVLGGGTVFLTLQEWDDIVRGALFKQRLFKGVCGSANWVDNKFSKW